MEAETTPLWLQSHKNDDEIKLEMGKTFSRSPVLKFVIIYLNAVIDFYIHIKLLGGITFHTA